MHTFHKQIMAADANTLKKFIKAEFNQPGIQECEYD